MSIAVVGLFLCRLSKFRFCCKCNLSFKSVELLSLGVLRCVVLLFRFHGVFCEVVQGSCCAEMLHTK